MCSLAVKESAPRSAYDANHGRAVSYTGGLGVLDIQPSGMPMTAPIIPTGPAPHSISALHPQRSDPPIAWTYAYGQPITHDCNVYYSGVLGRDPYGNFSGCLFGMPSHCMSYGLGGHSTHIFYPDVSQPPLLYFYPPAQNIYPSPQIGHAPVSGAMHWPILAMAGSKRDIQVCRFFCFRHLS
jgi:hypothetical protein